MLFGIDNDANVSLPDDYVAGLRPGYSAETLDTGKDGPGSGIFVYKSCLRVNGVDKVGAVRFRKQTAPKCPSSLNNRFAFLGRGQPESRRS
jgi:hypothetical protein